MSQYGAVPEQSESFTHLPAGGAPMQAVVLPQAEPSVEGAGQLQPVVGAAFAGC